MTDGKDAGMQYKSEVMAQIHAAAQDMRDLDLISKKTMAEFDELCLTPIKPQARRSLHVTRT